MKVRYLRTGQRDITAINAYIAQGDPEAATRVVERIRAATERLILFPALGRPGRVPGTRELILADLLYILPYRVRGQEIIIIRVLHGKQQWPPLKCSS